MTRDPFLDAALREAAAGRAESGIPIGSVLVIDGRIAGRGHNRRVQKGSAVLHAEKDCLENAGRLTARDYAHATLYSTLSPCDMFSGAILLYKIPRVIVGENRTFQGPEAYLRSRGIEMTVLDDPECVWLMHAAVHPRSAGAVEQGHRGVETRRQASGGWRPQCLPVGTGSFPGSATSTGFGSRERLRLQWSLKGPQCLKKP